MPGPTPWYEIPADRERFLAVLRETGSVSAASREIGIVRWTAHAARRSNAELARDWQDALDESVDALRREARRRAAEGVEEPVFQGGVEVGRIRKYSDGLLTLLLKAHDPAFRDSTKVDITAKHETSGKTTAELRKELIAELTALGLIHAESPSDRAAEQSAAH